MADTAIEWATKVWNPTTGCDRLSPGCDNCYALTMAKRLKGMGSAKYQRDGDPRTSGPGFGATLHPSALDIPLSWAKPERIFVNSMSDLFHADMPDEFIAKVFAVMAEAPRHTFQVLTKRHARMRSLLSSAGWPKLLQIARDDRHSEWDEAWDDVSPADFTWPLPNVWLGVSTENQYWADRRIPALIDTPAAVRFISAEPLLGPIDLDPLRCQNGCDEPYFDESTHTWRCIDCVNDGGHGELSGGWWLDPCPENDSGINWVIVGGESGPGARPMHPDWARSLRDQCTAAGVPFLFNQWGEFRPIDPDIPDNRCTNDYLVTDNAVVRIGDHSGPAPDGFATVRRVGKKAAGRRLDGRTWDQYPAVAGE